MNVTDFFLSLFDWKKLPISRVFHWVILPATNTLLVVFVLVYRKTTWTLILLRSALLTSVSSILLSFFAASLKNKSKGVVNYFPFCLSFSRKKMQPFKKTIPWNLSISNGWSSTSEWSRLSLVSLCFVRYKYFWGWKFEQDYYYHSIFT